MEECRKKENYFSKESDYRWSLKGWLVIRINAGAVGQRRTSWSTGNILYVWSAGSSISGPIDWPEGRLERRWGRDICFPENKIYRRKFRV